MGMTEKKMTAKSDSIVSPQVGLEYELFNRDRQAYRSIKKKGEQ